MWLADLHVHSTFSDGRMTISELVDFYGTRGFGCIAITDHLCENQNLLGRIGRYLNRTLTPENFPIYLETIEREARRARRRYDMLVLPGYELTKNSLRYGRSAHILGIGVSDFLAADGDVIDLSKGIRAQGGLVVAAHPVSTRHLEPQTYYLWDRRNELAKHFDAWEVASGPHLFQEVLASGLPMIATSDLHHRRQINAWKTSFDCDREPSSVLQAVRDQRVSFDFYQEETCASTSRLLRATRRTLSLGTYRTT